MDKFGIFNILNSLLNLNNNNNGSTKTQNEQNNVGFNNSEKESFTPSNKKIVTNGVNKNVNGKPLQSYMLETMSSHDKIIARVNARTNKN